jgi:hypothetical protein
MDEKLFEKAQQQLAVCERNIWINQDVCKRKKKILFPCYFLCLGAFSWLFFSKAFLTGSLYPIWKVLIGLVAVMTTVAIVSGISGSLLRKKAEKKCQIPAIPLDENNLENMNHLMLKWEEMDKLAKEYDDTLGCLGLILSAVIPICCYQYFSRLQNLEAPAWTVAYLVAFCVFFVFYDLALPDVHMDGAKLPLSDDVNEALRRYHRDCVQRAMLAHIKETDMRAYKKNRQEGRQSMGGNSDGQFDVSKLEYSGWDDWRTGEKLYRMGDKLVNAKGEEVSLTWATADPW